jgi:hypothetical protein
LGDGATGVKGRSKSVGGGFSGQMKIVFAAGDRNRNSDMSHVFSLRYENARSAGMRISAIWGAVLVALAGVGVAQADVKMSGSFVADAACPATQAIKSGKNPGNVSTAAGQSYDLLAGNKDAPTHYLIRVPGADPERRWVKISCGHVSGGSAATQPAAPAEQGKPAAPASGKPEYVFALSWQPAFCETFFHWHESLTLATRARRSAAASR